ncbi:MAG: SH3 domain-containing protein [Anaerolineae bacterium]|nr:SH3 domain-containing protein [Anaerolineae bacterium]
MVKQWITHVKRLNRIYRLWLVAGMLIYAALIISLPTVISTVSAQDQPTPYQANIPTRTTTPEPVITITPSRTATDFVSRISVQASDAETGANVRNAPDTEGTTILGKIKRGTFFEATARFGKWVQIRYLGSPTGIGWVFGELLEFKGGALEDLPEITTDAIPTMNVGTVQIEQTLSYITATPGALETATAAQAIATGQFSANSAVGGAVGEGTLLPTFTNPPPMVEATLPARAVAQNQGDLPPIIPIVGLAVIGLFGLIISGLRRIGG